MSSFTPVFRTNRSDYDSLVLFRHFRQSLLAAQTKTVKAFCIVAASKPGTEFHYLGLLWDCAFKAGIASPGAHSEPTSLPPVTATTSTSLTSPEILPTSICDFSALQPSTKRPFGSLYRRFRCRLQVPAPVQIPLLQTEKVPPLLDPFVTRVPSCTCFTPVIAFRPRFIPATISLSHSTTSASEDPRLSLSAACGNPYFAFSARRAPFKCLSE